MSAYTDFTYYSGTYLGNRIPQGDFPRLALRASEQVDQFTFDRAAQVITDNTDETAVAAIKSAVCAIADELSVIESQGGSDGVTSESVGNMSRSYNVDSARSRTTTQRLMTVARKHLSKTGLLFSGFLEGE